MTYRRNCLPCIAAIAGAVLLGGAPAMAGDIIAEWSTAKAPPVPELKPVTVDAKTTALLVLDLNKPVCTAERRPRCVDSIPKVKKLLDAARAAGMPVIYTFSGQSKPADVADPSIAPRDDEVMTARGPDKFNGSDLEKRLKEKGVQTVIVVGTAANGAVIGTGSQAAYRGFKVIVPVDGLSSETPYVEQYVVVNFATGSTLSAQSTLTRTDMIKF